MVYFLHLFTKVFFIVYFDVDIIFEAVKMKAKPEALLNFLHIVRDPSKVEKKDDCRLLIQSFAVNEKNETLKEVLKCFDRRVSGNKGKLSKRLFGFISRHHLRRCVYSRYRGGTISRLQLHCASRRRTYLQETKKNRLVRYVAERVLNCCLSCLTIQIG